MSKLNGIKYEQQSNTAQNQYGDVVRRNIVARYHQGCSGTKLNSTRYKVDLKGMNKRQIESNITRTLESAQNVYTSKFAIGFEIEKNSLGREVLSGRREIMGLFPTLFSAIENDGSVSHENSDGYEAITNILPLIPSSKWRNKIFNMMHDSRYFIEEEYSSSSGMYNNAYKCGGHVSISSEDYTNSKHFLQAVRPYLGIVYAMNRKRLANRYCFGNINAPINPTNAITRRDAKYNAIQLKNHGVLEFRLWSRVTSVNQLKNRYALMSEIVQASKNLISKASFNSRIRPILLRMYDNDMRKVDRMFKLAKSFDKMLTKNLLDENVIPFIYAYGNNNFNDSEHTIPQRYFTQNAFRMWKRGEVKFSNMVG
tara:strand:+ start:32 stop:1135 length:1104 start_codon:yes stop_codon:yes gene_type:complete